MGVANDVKRLVMMCPYQKLGGRVRRIAQIQSSDSLVYIASKNKRLYLKGGGNPGLAST